MLSYTANSRIRNGVLLVLLSWPLAAAIAQDSDQVSEWRALHDALTDADKLVDQKQAEEALQTLHGWEPWPKGISAANRALLLRTKVYAQLAVGDAAAAETTLRELQKVAPNERATLDTAYALGFVSGDAATAEEALRAIKDKAGESEQKTIATRQRRLKKVGTHAPTEAVKTDEGTPVSLAAREGYALVIDFWALRTKPADTHNTRFRELYERYKGQRVNFLGINSDGSARFDEARKYAREKHYDWPQYYEKSAEPALSQKAFQVGTPPWVVIIDRDGNVRAVGDPAEPLFQYALRAVVAETNGQYDLVEPRTVDQKKAPPKEKVKDAQPPKEKSGEQVKPGKEVKPKGELPSNPEAESKLKQARVYLKTGKKTDAKKLLQEIVQQYPGTREAREAEQILQSLP